MSPILKIHLAVTLYMTGVIWFIQLVHYPLFSAVKQDHGVFAQNHQNRTGLVVGPPMLVELFTAILLLFGNEPRLALWANLALLAVIWAATGFLQVPCHRRLLNGFDPTTHRRLVHSNWIRTAAWSLRSLLLLALAGGS